MSGGLILEEDEVVSLVLACVMVINALQAGVNSGEAPPEMVTFVNDLDTIGRGLNSNLSEDGEARFERLLGVLKDWAREQGK